MTLVHAFRIGRYLPLSQLLMILSRKVKAGMVRNRACIIERITLRIQLADVEVMGHRWSNSCRLHEHWHVLDRLSEAISRLVTAEMPV